MIFVAGDTICLFTAEHNLGIDFAVARRFEFAAVVSNAQLVDDSVR